MSDPGFVVVDGISYPKPVLERPVPPPSSPLASVAESSKGEIGEVAAKLSPSQVGSPVAASPFNSVADQATLLVRNMSLLELGELEAYIQVRMRLLKAGLPQKKVFGLRIT